MDYWDYDQGQPEEEEEHTCPECGGQLATDLHDKDIKLKSLIPALDLLQDRLSQGCYIEHQDGKWWLFNGVAEKHGEGICSGETIREMLINLIFVNLCGFLN